MHHQNQNNSTQYRERLGQRDSLSYSFDQIELANEEGSLDEENINTFETWFYTVRRQSNTKKDGRRK